MAVFQGGSVCLKVDVCHCSLILFTFPHFTSFWDVIEGLKTRKSKKMCLSNYPLMAVVETQQAVARPAHDWSSSVWTRLSLDQWGHVTGASKDGRLQKLTRDLERVIFRNSPVAMLDYQPLIQVLKRKSYFLTQTIFYICVSIYVCKNSKNPIKVPDTSISIC